MLDLTGQLDRKLLKCPQDDIQWNGALPDIPADGAERPLQGERLVVPSGAGADGNRLVKGDIPQGQIDIGDVLRGAAGRVDIADRSVFDAEMAHDQVADG